MKTKAFVASISLILAANTALAHVDGPEHGHSPVNNTEAMFEAAAACDQSNNTMYQPLFRQMPLALHEMMNKPTLRELMNDKTPTVEQQRLIEHYSEAVRRCQAEINWLVDKNFSPRFAKAWRNYMYKTTEINLRLAQGRESFGESWKQLYASSVIVQAELDEYRYRFTDGKQTLPVHTNYFETCVKRNSHIEPSDALSYSLRKSAGQIMNDSRCHQGNERAQSAFEKHFWDLED